MTHRMPCEEALAAPFDARRHTPSTSQERAVLSHVATCESCRRAFVRSADMLEAAASEPALDWQFAPSTDVFSSAFDAAFSAPVVAAEPEPDVDDEADEADEAGEPAARGWSPLWLVAATSAAAVIVAFFVGRATVEPDVTLDATPAPGLEVAETPIPATELPAVDPEGVGPGATAAAPATAFAVADLADARCEGVRLFAADGAQTTLTGCGGDTVLDVVCGDVLVEYMPGEGRSLTVRSGDVSFDVTGTVFYVRSAVEGVEVGVLVGGVTVRGGDDTPVSPGSSWSSETGTVGEVDHNASSLGAGLIDLDEHARAVAAMREAAASPVIPTLRTNQLSPDPHGPDGVDTRVRRALIANDSREAARLLERALLAGADGRHDATWRLELVRIYLQELGQTDDAVRHLGLFVERHPDDVATGHARARLCSLLAETDPRRSSWCGSQR